MKKIQSKIIQKGVIDSHGNMFSEDCVITIKEERLKENGSIDWDFSHSKGLQLTKHFLYGSTKR